MEDIRQRRCIRARAMADTCQAEARREDIMNFLAQLGSIITVKVRRMTRRLAKESLRENLIIRVTFLWKAYSLFRRMH